MPNTEKDVRATKPTRTSSMSEEKYRTIINEKPSTTGVTVPNAIDLKEGM